MTTTHTSRFTKDTPLEEPIEVRFVTGESRDGYTKRLVLTAYVASTGVVNHYMTDGESGMPQSLSNLQHRGPTAFPTKPLPGWQAEVVAFAGECLYDVEEIR
jgi:hypothetical protein